MTNYIPHDENEVKWVNRFSPKDEKAEKAKQEVEDKAANLAAAALLLFGIKE